MHSVDGAILQVAAAEAEEGHEALAHTIAHPPRMLQPLLQPLTPWHPRVLEVGWE